MEVALGGAESGVPHRRLHTHEVDAPGDEKRSVAMAEIVKAQRFESDRISCAPMRKAP
jgi:hypothetical protein